MKGLALQGRGPKAQRKEGAGLGMGTKQQAPCARTRAHTHTHSHTLHAEQCLKQGGRGLASAEGEKNLWQETQGRAEQGQGLQSKKVRGFAAS